MSRPLASVGMPVYNSERTVGAAIESIVRQTWPEWELIISDNASTDRTGDICREYAAREPRIRYERQPENRGAGFNFRKVLADSKGEFFMWQAGDDRRSDDFLEANAEFLIDHPEYVASCSPVRIDSEEFDARYSGDAPATGSRAQRILAVMPAHANGRFYSLFRRQAVLGCQMIDGSFLGSDWALIVELAAKGPMHRVDRGWTLLGAGGASRSANFYRSMRQSWVDLCMPFRALSTFTWAFTEGFTPVEKLQLAGRLAKLNAFGMVAQSREAWRRHRG